MVPHIYYLQTSIPLSDLKSAVHSLLEKVQKDNLSALTFFALCPDDLYPFILQRLKDVVYAEVGRTVLVTFVPELLIGSESLCVEVYEIGNARLTGGVCGSVHYQYIEDGVHELLLVEGIPSSDFAKPISWQGKEIFEKLRCLLYGLGFKTSDIVRQWNYIGNITGYRETIQNYQAYNDARSLFYQDVQWCYGYPAATGIGAHFNGIIVSCIALKGKSGKESGIYALGNPLQIAAHAYSSEVLVGSNQNALKSTPKFERAKLVEFADNRFCFISGTASIRGEKSTHVLSPAMQARQTIENINYLISAENLKRHACPPVLLELCNLRVYIKDEAFYEEIRSIVAAEFPDIPTVYLVTDICRTELLVEMEGICVCKQKD